VALTLLGIVDRFSYTKSGPGARLRPLFQASSDKKRWIPLEDEYPNDEVVSWWQPPTDVHLNKAWLFQVELSPTYDPDNKHHDYYRVKGMPSPAVELIDVAEAADPEDVRSFMLDDGLTVELCAARRLVFRDRGGTVIGPLELSIRDGRLHLEEEGLEALIPVSRLTGDPALVSWEGHRFLPLEGWSRKAGEADFSPNTLFLKRVLRELKEITPSMIDNAKLTGKLIGAYVSAVEKMSLTPLQRQRLKRLHRLAAASSSGVSLAEDAVPELLSLLPVKEALDAAREEAAHKAIEARRSVLDELDGKRAALEQEIVRLRAEEDRLRDEIACTEKNRADSMASFEESVQKKFQEITRSASSFLADIALVRAALSDPVREPPSRTSPQVSKTIPAARALAAAEIPSTVRAQFDREGVGCMLSGALLASWASGFVPMLYGARGRDALGAADKSLFGRKSYFATLSATSVSPTDLLDLPVFSEYGLSSVRELVSVAGRSTDLFLLVFENINLCQLDSTLVPLVRTYAEIHARTSSSRSPIAYATPAGLWPSNMLFAGIMIDSPLALPMSRELWSYATFLDAGAKLTCTQGKRVEQNLPDSVSRIDYGTWTEWLETIDGANSSDTLLVATHVGRQVETSALSKRMFRRLAGAVDCASPGLAEDKRAGLFLDMAVIPYLLSRGLDPEEVLRDSPADAKPDDAFVARVTALFEKWGLEAR
jgi:hypothetical protein